MATLGNIAMVGQASIIYKKETNQDTQDRSITERYLLIRNKKQHFAIASLTCTFTMA